MSTSRKSVLLRFQPELLGRVDDARGLLDRHTFLMQLIDLGLETLGAATVPPPVRCAAPSAAGLFSSTNAHDDSTRESGPDGGLPMSGDAADGGGEGPDVLSSPSRRQWRECPRFGGPLCAAGGWCDCDEDGVFDSPPAADVAGGD